MSKLPPLSEVIASFGLNAKKALGQNFILDSNLTDKIVRRAAEAISPQIDFANDTIIEIGPGPGGLTRSILEAGATNLIAIERDERCLAALNEVQNAYPNRLTLINDDALKIKAHELGKAPRHIIAKLPYNVATPLLFGWLKQIDEFASLTLLFQKEVAERIVAKPKSDAYGRLGVMASWLCNAEKLFDIGPKAFTPPPKVTSTLVHLTPKKDRFKADFAALEKVTASAFGQRRKMLRSSLKSLGLDSIKLCEQAGINPEARAETLTIAEFCKLAELVETNFMNTKNSS